VSTKRSNDFPVVSSRGIIGKASVEVLTTADGSVASNKGFNNPVVLVKSSFVLDTLQTVGKITEFAKLADAANNTSDFRVDLSSSAMMGFIRNALLDANYTSSSAVIVLAQTVIKESASAKDAVVETPEIHVFNRFPIFSATFLATSRNNRGSVIPLDISMDAEDHILRQLKAQVGTVINSLSHQTTLPKWFSTLNTFMTRSPQGDATYWNEMLMEMFYNVEYDLDLIIKAFGNKNANSVIEVAKLIRYTTADGKLKRKAPKVYLHELSRFTKQGEGEVFARSSHNAPFTSYVDKDSCSRMVNSICTLSVFPDDEVGDSTVGGLYTLSVLTDDDIEERNNFRASHSQQVRPQTNQRQGNQNQNGPASPYGDRKGSFSEKFSSRSNQQTTTNNPYASNKSNFGARFNNGRGNNMQQPEQHVPHIVYLEPVNNTYINYDRLSSIAVVNMPE